MENEIKNLTKESMESLLANGEFAEYYKRAKGSPDAINRLVERNQYDTATREALIAQSKNDSAIPEIVYTLDAFIKSHPVNGKGKRYAFYAPHCSGFLHYHYDEWKETFKFFIVEIETLSDLHKLWKLLEEFYNPTCVILRSAPSIGEYDETDAAYYLHGRCDYYLDLFNGWLEG